MDKRKICVLNISNAGVGKFRFTDPHICLDKNHHDEWIVEIFDTQPETEELLTSNYDIVFIQSSKLTDDTTFKIVEVLKENGIKVVCDIDDYWKLPMSHALYYIMKQHVSKLLERLPVVDMVTTTTKFLAKEIRKYNKNVAVLPNAIDPTEQQFIPNPIESEMVRVGWSGGSSHLVDFQLIRGLHSKITNLNTPVQMLMCGFNNKQKDPKTGKLEIVDKPKSWIECEEVFTNNYLLRNDEYVNRLKMYKNLDYHDVEKQTYRRIWTKEIEEYGTSYNHIDIVLALLVDTKFNRMKSQLKMLEAGFHKKPMVVSNVTPYQIDGIHGENCFMVDEKRSHKDFPKYIKKLINSESMRKEMGEALYETVSKKYDLNLVTKKRKEVYNSLFK